MSRISNPPTWQSCLTNSGTFEGSPRLPLLNGTNQIHYDRTEVDSGGMSFVSDAAGVLVPHAHVSLIPCKNSEAIAIA